MSVQVECSDKDLHSGVYGGSVHEAMTDLILLMGEHGSRHSLRTWETSWRGLVSRLSPAFGACHHPLWSTLLSFPLAPSRCSLFL